MAPKWPKRTLFNARIAGRLAGRFPYKFDRGKFDRGNIDLVRGGSV